MGISSMSVLSVIYSTARSERYDDRRDKHSAFSRNAETNHVTCPSSDLM